MTGELARTANDVAYTVASRLADTEAMARRWDDHRRESAHTDTAGTQWRPHVFCQGYPGTATLLAELAVHEPALRQTARAHLAAGVAAARDFRGIGVMTGLAGLGWAARAVAESPGDCARLISQCDSRIENALSGLLRSMSQDSDDLRTGHFDAISGLTGTARYLLRAHGPQHPVVIETTEWIAGLCMPSERHPEMPKWATYERHVSVPAEQPPAGGRQLNLGLAHGIAGPLAYLSVAIRAGVQVESAAPAVRRVADWLMSWHGLGAGGTNWPSYVSEEEELRHGPAKHGDRGAWCYGTPGIARALYLAGSALDDDSLRSRATKIWLDFLDEQLDSAGLGDAAMCHGWAGILRIAQFMAEEADGCDGGRVERIVRRIIEAHDVAAPLGFVYNTLDATRWADNPALLDGAAGTAAALWAYANPGAGRTGWEEAFLLC